MPKIIGLSPKQQRFCEEYIKDLDNAEATKRAGYKTKNDNVAKCIGYENLTKPAIKNEIVRLKAELAAKCKDTAVEWMGRVRNTEDRARNEDDYVAEQRAQEIEAKHFGFYEADNRQKTQETRNYTLIELQQILAQDEEKAAKISETQLAIPG